MDCLEVQWDNELAIELIKILENRYISPKYNKDRYILKIAKEAKLNCELNVLANILIRAINIGGFDTLYLDEFSSVAVMYRVQKKGLPVYVVMPEPFKRILSTKSNKVSHINKSPANAVGGNSYKVGAKVSPNPVPAIPNGDNKLLMSMKGNERSNSGGSKDLLRIANDTAKNKKPFEGIAIKTNSKTTLSESESNNTNKRKEQSNDTSLVLYKENAIETGTGNNRNLILFAAFIFFVAIVVAAVVAKKNSRSKR
jgi:hypothetical protein